MGSVDIPPAKISLKKGYTNGGPSAHTLSYSIEYANCNSFNGRLNVTVKIPFNNCKGYCITRPDGTMNCTDRTDGMGAMLKNITPVPPSMEWLRIGYNAYFNGQQVVSNGEFVLYNGIRGSGANETEHNVDIPASQSALYNDSNGRRKYTPEEFKTKFEIKVTSVTSVSYTNDVVDYLNQLVDLDMAGFYGVYRAEGDAYFGGNLNTAEHDYKKARAAYKKALQYKPGDDYVTQKLKELDQAEAAQKQAATANQNNSNGQNNSNNNQQNQGNQSNSNNSTVQNKQSGSGSNSPSDKTSNGSKPPFYEENGKYYLTDEKGNSFETTKQTYDIVSKNVANNKQQQSEGLTYDEQMKLEAAKIDQRKAEMAKQSSENAKQYYNQVQANLVQIEKNSQMMESQVTSMVNSYFANDKIFKSWNNASKLDISGNNPRELLQQYQQKIQELQRLTEEKKRNINAAVQQNIATYNGDANYKGFNDAATQFMGAAAQMAANNKEAKAKAELKKQLQNEFNKVKKDMVDEYNRNASTAFSAGAGAISERDEEYYNNLGYYFECRIDKLNSSFSYDNTNWMDNNYYCKEPSQPNYYQNESMDEYASLKRAKEKYKNYQKGDNYAAQYLSAARQLTNSAIGINNQYTEAYAFRAQIEDDPIEAFTSARKATDLNPNNSEYKTLYAQKLNPFSTAFFKALEQEDTETIKKVLQRGLHTNLTNGTEAPVMYCLKNNKATALQLLILNNAALSARENLYQYLDFAAVNNADKCITWLIEQKLNPDGNPAINSKYSPLLLACDNNANKAALVLIGKNANLKNNYQKLIQNKEVALKYKLSVMVIEAGLVSNDSSDLGLAYQNNPEALKDDYVVTAISEGKAAFLKKALRLKPNKDINNAVILAPDENILKILVQNGYNLSGKNAEGQTPLHFAINNNNANKAAALIKTGADINALNTDGWTPLQLAVHKKQASVASMLMLHKADINAKGAYGWTALHYAVREYEFDPSIIDNLLSYGADKHIKDKWGRTPYDIAKEREFKSLKAKLK
ncbi:MAG: ankyrin repeat domain-containing protein [Bacteroidia bacterium]